MKRTYKYQDQRSKISKINIKKKIRVNIIVVLYRMIYATVTCHLFLVEIEGKKC